MNYRSCVVVMIGEDTSKRKWVKHEIKKAWNEERGVLGIYIHNIKCPNNGKSNQGNNPFDNFTLDNGSKKLSSVVKCYNPKSSDAYNDIKDNLEDWIEEAIKIRKDY